MVIDMPAKIIGIFILITMSALTGCLAANGLKRRVDALRQLKLMLENIRLMIRYEAAPLGEIVCRLCESGAYGRLDFLPSLRESLEGEDIYSAEMNFNLFWSAALEEHRGAFSEEDMTLLANLGSVLGTTDAEGQLSALSLAEAETSNLISGANEQYRAKGRLYRSLGAVAGALIAVVII
ncbi:MAG: stage III sporulation protein AB [Huintestinicola sp.]